MVVLGQEWRAQACVLRRASRGLARVDEDNEASLGGGSCGVRVPACTKTAMPRLASPFQLCESDKSRVNFRRTPESARGLGRLPHALTLTMVVRLAARSILKQGEHSNPVHARSKCEKRAHQPSSSSSSTATGVCDLARAAEQLEPVRPDCPQPPPPPRLDRHLPGLHVRRPALSSLSRPDESRASAGAWLAGAWVFL